MKLLNAILNGLGLFLILTVVLGLSGCIEDQPSVPETSAARIGRTSTTVSKFTFESHEYVNVKYYSVDAGGAICHSESCPCKTSAKVER